MINEQIVYDEAKKKNIVVTDNDINNKIASIEKQVGGAQSLDQLLKQQGQDRSTLKDQVKLQLTIEKLYDNEATVSAKEIDQFIAANKNQMTATDSAGQKIEAEQTLKQQKISQIFQEKFPQLKQAANIQIY